MSMSPQDVIALLQKNNPRPVNPSDNRLIALEAKIASLSALEARVAEIEAKIAASEAKKKAAK